MPELAAFTVLRILQGLCMATAFALTLAYLGEHESAAGSAGAFAAYVTGNVASNLFGRLLAAGLVDHLGLSSTFVVFAGLNLAGALLVWFTVERLPRRAPPTLRVMRAADRLQALLAEPALRAAFAIGFLILFAFIGVFTYVNFLLVEPPFGVGMMMLGLVYFVFLPAIVTTPLAGRVVARFGTRAGLRAAFALALAGLPPLLVPRLGIVLAGLALVAVGTFLAQAIATGFVNRAAASDRGAASGLYLASYFLGGMVGSAVVGQVFDRLGWTACVLVIAGALVVAAGLSSGLVLRCASVVRSQAA
jgi:predicted MFS family arabinose efflux permease